MKKLMMMAMVAATMVGAAKAENVAVAVKSPDEKTLTFYYMDATQTNALQGTVYVVPENANDESDIPWHMKNDNPVTNVVFDASFAAYRPKSTACWFYEFKALTGITNIQNLDTSSVTIMAGMFFACSALTTLDVSSFDTANVTKMNFMFRSCSSLTALNVSGFDTSNVDDIASMFNSCPVLTALDLSGFDTANVTDMSYMLGNCSNLKTIYVSDAFTTNKVTYSKNMFSGCTALVGGNGTGYDGVHKDAEYARIDSEKNPGYFTTKPLTFTAEEDGSTVTFGWANAQWVSNSTDGVTWNKYEAGTTNTLAKVGDYVMFKGSGVTTGYGKHFTMTGKIAASGDVGTLTDGKGGTDVTLTESCYAYMFSGCTSLTAAPKLPATTLAAQCYSAMFEGCTSLTAAPKLPATTMVNMCYENMFNNCTSLTAVPKLPATTLAMSCYNNMFAFCTALKVNAEGPGTEWSIPDEATEKNQWNQMMFSYGSGTVPYEPSIGVTYYVVPTVAFKPIEVENATWEIIEDNQVMTLRDRVHTNGTIKVRYTAKDGLAFADGSYVKTVLVGKATTDPFAPTGYAPAAPTEWTQATASTTVDIDTRTDKLYFDADDILPVWANQGAKVTATNTSMVAETRTIVYHATTTNWYGWKPTYLGKYQLTKSYYDKGMKYDNADITYTTPVYVSTNAALDVDGTTWALTDAGGSPITEMDEEGRFKVPTNSQLKVVYTLPAEGNYYFKDGTKTYEAAFTATGAEEFDAATMIGDNKPKAGDIGTPKVQLGVVAQRYPWDGKLDVQYKALYTPAETYKLKVTVTVDGVAKEATTDTTITSGISTYVYDVKANFGEVKTKNCKVKATLEASK